MKQDSLTAELEKLLADQNIPEHSEDDQDEPELDETLPIVVYELVESGIDVVDPKSKDLKADYDFVRANYHGLIGRTNGAIDLALRIAKASDSPRALEVISMLMKTSADISKSLMDLQKDIKGIATVGNDKPTVVHIEQNNYYDKKNDPKSISDELDKLDLKDG